MMLLNLHWETTMLWKVCIQLPNRIALGKELDLELALASVNRGVPSGVGMGGQDSKKITCLNFHGLLC